MMRFAKKLLKKLKLWISTKLILINW